MNGGLPAVLAELKSCYLEVKEIEVGDGVLGYKVGFERKRGDDFLKSLIEDRKLFRQLHDLANAYEKPFLVIEGMSKPSTYDFSGRTDIRDTIYTQRRINPVALRGILISIQLDLGIQIFWTNCIEETAQLLIHIARREQNVEEKRFFSAHGKRSHLSPDEQLNYILSAIPDIGEGKALLLLRHFNTLESIANADYDDLLVVPGIGNKTAAHVREIFTREYKGELK